MSWVLFDDKSQQWLSLVKVDVFELVLGLCVGLCDQLVFLGCISDHNIHRKYKLLYILVVLLCTYVAKA